ncbi:uncharacterized protein EURHEDRAFT_242618 [Aspergillus ruber CBS 135680]|uniref:Ankyrin repeat-containing domain protein n=1 Tax=Aspergillus ruber (strain CBS 135680) TaxID=1388766 RepID=A0A017S5C1_ASPRC|nr:uncharacterized protein EURHEDRAFT_242618 [Aspergillus ruber CBS 135680]EYE91370.1 hypothetical protein EURHEDRAFT_242618 [Aspergillus ruber CBS 135680]
MISLGNKPRVLRGQADFGNYCMRRNPFKEIFMAVAEQPAQLAIIKLLLEWGGFDVRTQDIDGNTALYYLAATLAIGSETVKVLRAMNGGKEVWQSSRNRCGLTPKQLMEE